VGIEQQGDLNHQINILLSISAVNKKTIGYLVGSEVKCIAVWKSRQYMGTVKKSNDGN